VGFVPLVNEVLLNVDVLLDPTMVMSEDHDVVVEAPLSVVVEPMRNLEVSEPSAFQFFMMEGSFLLLHLVTQLEAPVLKEVDNLIVAIVENKEVDFVNGDCMFSMMLEFEGVFAQVSSQF